MCGINLLFGNLDHSKIEEMSKHLKHRGPDHCGTNYFDDEYEVSIGLNRLAILDPTEDGVQPMNYDGLTISFNGEIYNFSDIRETLKEAGYQFNSDTDTEVILKGYHHYGDELFKQLNGIFAVCLVDRRDEFELVFCRDRLGIKPLYYYKTGNSLVVSSEQKSIIEPFRNDLQFTTDGIGASKYLHTKGGPESLIKEISSFDPGKIYRYDGEEFESLYYCDVFNLFDTSVYQRQKQMSESTLINRLDNVLNNAIKRQLVSDVPLATICSGGVDSSLVTAIASTYKSDIEVYHVSVDYDPLDESQYARMVADHLGLEMNTITLDEDLYLDMLEQCLYDNEVPFTHPNSVGVAAVNELAHSDDIKVLMTGEGADELFGGYGRYKAFYNMLRWNHLNIPRRMLNAANDRKQIMDPDTVSMAFLEDEDDILEYFLKDQIRLSHTDDLLSSDRRETIDRLRHQLQEVESGPDVLSAAYILSDLHHYLRPLLHRADRMSMRSSVEARVPFLDNEVLEFAMNLPHRYKVNPEGTKYLLKKVAERYLPNEIVYRKKMGFGLPIEEWLSNCGYDTSRGEQAVFYDIWSGQTFSPTK